MTYNVNEKFFTNKKSKSELRKQYVNNFLYIYFNTRNKSIME